MLIYTHSSSANTYIFNVLLFITANTALDEKLCECGWSPARGRAMQLPSPLDHKTQFRLKWKLRSIYF